MRRPLSVIATAVVIVAALVGAVPAGASVPDDGRTEVVSTTVAPAERGERVQLVPTLPPPTTTTTVSPLAVPSNSGLCDGHR